MELGRVIAIIQELCPHALQKVMLAVKKKFKCVL